MMSLQRILQPRLGTLYARQQPLMSIRHSPCQHAILGRRLISSSTPAVVFGLGLACYSALQVRKVFGLIQVAMRNEKPEQIMASLALDAKQFKDQEICKARFVSRFAERKIQTIVDKLIPAAEISFLPRPIEYALGNCYNVLLKRYAGRSPHPHLVENAPEICFDAILKRYVVFCLWELHEESCAVATVTHGKDPTEKADVYFSEMVRHANFAKVEHSVRKWFEIHNGELWSLVGWNTRWLLQGLLPYELLVQAWFVRTWCLWNCRSHARQVMIKLSG